VAENANGRPRYRQLREEGQQHQIEQVGAQLRAMMPFVSAGRQRLEDVSGG
jgi:ketol-acid reductoisomerase